MTAHYRKTLSALAGALVTEHRFGRLWIDWDRIWPN